MRLRTHEFLSRRGKEPKAAGGRRGFHAARRPPDPPLTKSLCRWSLAGAPRTGFPTVPHERPSLKTFRFQRGPVLRGGKSQRVRNALCAWHSFGGAGTKKPPLKGEAPAVGGRRGFVLRTPQGRGGSVSRRDHNPKNKKTRPRIMGAQAKRKAQAYSQPLFGRGGSGGEALLSEKRPLPQRSSHHRPHYVFSAPCVVEGADAAHLVDA